MPTPLTPGLLLAFAVFPLLCAHGGEPGKRWTHGRSVCDPVARPLLEGVGAAPSAKLVLQSWDYALEDTEFLTQLPCQAEDAASAAAALAELRRLREAAATGLREADCAAAGPEPSLRVARMREAEAALRSSEAFFEAALQGFERTGARAKAAAPESVAFDDCRARAARGWATAHTSLNRLSCEAGRALEQLSAYRERAEGDVRVAQECARPAAPVVVPEAPRMAKDAVTGLEPMPVLYMAPVREPAAVIDLH